MYCSTLEPSKEIVDSYCARSMNCPFPVRFRCLNAARTARVAWFGLPLKSGYSDPVPTGGRSGDPVIPLMPAPAMMLMPLPP